MVNFYASVAEVARITALLGFDPRSMLLPRRPHSTHPYLPITRISKDARSRAQALLRKRRLWVSLSATVVMMLLVRVWFLAHPLDKHSFRIRGVLRFSRANPIGQHHVEIKWQQAEARKLRMPKDTTYHSMSPEQLEQHMPIRVISLARASDRRATIMMNLKAVGLHSYEVVDAVDYKNISIPDRLVRKYVFGIRYGLWKHGNTHQRGKVAIDISHYQNLDRIAKENRPAILVEDDAGFPQTSSWYGDLLTVLQELPQDWDILYLNGCFQTLGRNISEHVTIVKDTACTIGYVATPKFARKILSAVRRAHWVGVTPVIDLLYRNMIQQHELNAYISRSPLVTYTTQSLESTIATDHVFEGMTYWEKWWMGGAD